MQVCCRWVLTNLTPNISDHPNIHLRICTVRLGENGAVGGDETRTLQGLHCTLNGVCPCESKHMHVMEVSTTHHLSVVSDALSLQRLKSRASHHLQAACVPLGLRRDRIHCREVLGVVGHQGYESCVAKAVSIVTVRRVHKLPTGRPLPEPALVGDPVPIMGTGTPIGAPMPGGSVFMTGMLRPEGGWVAMTGGPIIPLICRAGCEIW